MQQTSDDSPGPGPAVSEPDRPRRWYSTIHPPVFWPSLLIILGFVAVAIIGGDAVGEAISTVQTGIVSGFGWY